ncbi:MAG: hypothetical protein A2X94_06730 [Bdellovibrionales bacterium GWB1_55_8]|nr:MAG: hypothetical protein A2X94_06730 [Bdellovibrionales bacterium GWB1_55_8]
MKRPFSAVVSTLFACAFSLTVTACNVFEPLDGPSSDAQLLSAARAAFDQGRFEEAADFYGRLSSDYAEVSASESAFQILDQYGASMGAFMSSFGQGMENIGVGFTRLAPKLTSDGRAPGQAKRVAIFGAFRKIDNITSNPELRGLIRFVSAAALLSEILAENTGASGLFQEADLVADPNACLTLGAGCAAPGGACRIPTGKTINDSGTAFELSLNTAGRPSDPAALAKLDVAAPNFQMIQAALVEINHALTTEIAASGDLGGSLQGFSAEFINVYGLVLDATPNCYRQGLLLNGIGAN